MFDFVKKIIDNKTDSAGKISNWSYQRFCRFYGHKVLLDPNFDKEIEQIKNCVLVDNMEKIDEISKKVECPLVECIFKLRYLKNKRIIGDNYYINSYTKEIKKCNEEDVSLINKYYEMIYQKHYTISEMLEEFRKNGNNSIKKEDIYNELIYLYNRSLINGIKFHDDGEIIYYSLEKKKLMEKYVTLNCPNCGALVDIPKFDRNKCEYCNTIVEDTYSRRDVNV